MGHATHFLQRLDRVNELQVELALTLYRDDELLKTVLSSVALPEQAERVAVALGDPVEGPFVVLTRTGRFVTCLGEGMRATGLPVITRAQLDLAASRVQRMRDEIDRIVQLVNAGAGGEVKRLLHAVDTSGPRFCREDAQQLARVVPLFAHRVAERVVLMIKDVFDRLRYLCTLRLDHLSTRERDAVVECGALAWAMGNVLPLVAVSDTRQLMKLAGRNLRSITEHQLAGLAFEACTVVHGHRALWIMARSGKDGLSLLKPRVDPASRFATHFFRELALGAVAFGSPRLREQAVHKLLPAQPEGVDVRLKLASVISNEIRREPLQDADLATAVHAAEGRKLVRAALSSSASPAQGADEDVAISDQLAHAAVATRTTNWWKDGEDFAQMRMLVCGLPWLATAPLEDLYLPRVWAEQLHPVPTVDSVLRWIKPCVSMHGFGRAKTVVRAAPKPARNASCPCGSGKKWKRCCVTTPVGGQRALVAT